MLFNEYSPKQFQLFLGVGDKEQERECKEGFLQNVIRPALLLFLHARRA
jgi:hypothetical protein